jgi:CRISPR-associated protein Csb2
MPTLAEFRFLAGRLHTTPWGSHVNEGVVEWPPSPWRLLRALLATWHLKATEQIPVTVLRSLVGHLAAQPPRYQLPAASTGHTRHYMPFNEGRSEKTTKIFDTFVAVEKNTPLLVCWDVELPAVERAALDTLLTRLAYLGRAESLVEAQLLPPDEIARFRADVAPIAEDPSARPDSDYVRLLTPLSESAYQNWLAELSRTLAASNSAHLTGKKSKTKKVSAPTAPEDLFAALHADTGELQAAGWLGEPPGSRFHYYTLPSGSLDAKPSRARSLKHSARPPTVARYAIASNVLPRITAALLVAERVHQALLARFPNGAPPPVLLGRDNHGKPLTGHAHAHIFCEPRAKEDTIAHVTVYASGGFDAEAQRALRSLGRVWGHGGHDIELVLIDLGWPATFSDSALFKPSKVWQSLTPFVSTRHPKTYRDGRPKTSPEGWQIDSPEHEILRWLSKRPLGPGCTVELPIKIESLAAPSISGRPLRWHDFNTRRQRGDGARAHQPARGFRLTFATPVSGPIALGYASHFGLGLFTPMDRSNTEPPSRFSLLP